MNPINLKRNDKLILIVGIIILVVSAIGIAAYTSYEPDDVKIFTEPEMKTYEVIFSESSDIDEVEGYANKRDPYSKPFTISSPIGSILTNVDISIDWQDDYTYGLIIKKGEDTLTARITYEGETKKYSGVRSDKKEIASFKINDVPILDNIEAENDEDASDIIDSMFSENNEATFDLDVEVDTGERIWRLLKYIRDQGNGFKLEITYHYFTYNIEEIEEIIPASSNQDFYNGACGEFYKNLCYGRGMI